MAVAVAVGEEQMVLPQTLGTAAQEGEVQVEKVAQVMQEV
jgi:SpoU rRNA methylase family enzyme